MNRPLFCLLMVLAWSAPFAVQGETDLRDRYRRPAAIPEPAANRTTPERAELGKMLFFDPRLSGNGTMSCATCHNPALGWSDALRVSRGANQHELKRHTPTIINAAFNPVQTWDGRFDTLEEQAASPMASTEEMNLAPSDPVRRLRAIPRYEELFQAAYGAQGISLETITKALAVYERTIVSKPAPFDSYVDGDSSAISEAAIRGFVLFNRRAKCASCHSGWNLTDGSFHDIGVDGSDPGRGKIIGIEELNHTFKTPSLRDVAERAPYTHNGSEATLRDMVELYNRGGRVKRSTLAEEIQPLHLTDNEVDDLIAFMRTLTSRDTPVTPPELPAQ